MKANTTLDIEVRACSSRNAVSKIEYGTVHISIKAPAKNNRANAELVKYLGKVLGVGQDSVRILKGAASCSKVIQIVGVADKHVIMAMLEKEAAER